MKAGILLTVGAVLLSSATLLWSLWKSIPYPITYPAGNLSLNRKPDSVTAHTFFFHIGRPVMVDVYAPVYIELDSGFKGVELIGDTSLFKALSISSAIDTSFETVNIRFEKDHPLTNTDSMFTKRTTPHHISWEQLDQAGIIVKIGIGAGKMPKVEYREFAFHNCRKVTATRIASIHPLKIRSRDVDSLDLNIKTRILTLDPLNRNYSPHDLSGSNVEVRKGWIRLQGTCDRVLLMDYSNGEIDASQLTTDDFFAEMLYKVDAVMFAGKAVSISQIESNIKILGNPPYQHIYEWHSQPF